MIDKITPEESKKSTASRNAVVENSGVLALGSSLEIVNSVVVKPPVPRGWTTLYHGTDTERWQLGERLKTITRDGLSVISAQDAAQARANGRNVGSSTAYDTTGNYSRGSATASPVEVRILFLDNIWNYHRPGEEDLRAALTPRTTDLLRTWYQPRHPVVPRGEQMLLVSNGMDEDTGRIVEYFLPRSVESDYNSAVQLEAQAARLATNPVK